MPRRPCRHCAFKHCGQALVILEEHISWWSDLNDPHAVRIVGHVAEIEEHISEDPKLAHYSELLRGYREQFTGCLGSIAERNGGNVAASTALADALRRLSGDILELWAEDASLSKQPQNGCVYGGDRAKVQ